MIKTPMRLLWKAQARPLNFESIYRRKTEQEKRDFRLTEKTEDEWKVELATQAMSIVLDEILKAHQFLENKVDFSGLTVASFDRESKYRPLLPLALGALLQGKGVGEVLNESKGEGYLGGADVRGNIAAFLETFREWAKNAANSGQVPSVDEVLRVMNEQFRNLVPSETIRRHLATVASDILRLVSIPLDEVIEPIDRAYSNLIQRGVSLTSFLNQGFVDLYFRGLEGFQDLAVRMFSWAALLQHIVNRLIGGWPHSLWRTVASDERFVSGRQVSESYLPVFWWAAHFPSDRKGLSPSDFDKVEGGDEKIFEILPLIGAVTAVGERIVPNMAGSWELSSQVKEAILGEFTGGRKAEAVMYRRDLPGCLLGVARNLLVVLEGLKSRILEVGDDLEVLTKRLEAMPTVAEFVSSILRRLGYSLDKLAEGEVRQAVINQLETMMAETRQLMRAYWDEAKRIDESPMFFAAIDSILSGRQEVEIDLQRALEIVKKINLMVVELASSSGRQWADVFRGSMVSSGGASFWSQVMKLYLGGYSPFSGVPLWTRSQRNIDDAVRELINAVMTIDERILSRKNGESVMDFESLKFLIDMVINALNRIKTEVIPEADRNYRTFLEVKARKKKAREKSAREWEEVLNNWISELSKWSDEMGKVLDEGGAPLEVVGKSALEKMEEVVLTLKKKLIESWKEAASETAERLIQNLSYVLSNRDATEFLRWLFRARSAEVKFVREIGGEVGESGDEGEVVVAATEEVPTSERLEEALFRLLGYVAESWVKGDEVADKFLKAISGLIDIFGVSQDDVHKKLLGILNEIERGAYVPKEVAEWIPNAAQRIRFAQKLKDLLSPTSQQIEPLAPPPTGPEKWEEEEMEGEVKPEEEGAVPAGGGALQEDGVGEGGQSDTSDEEEEGERRLLLAKFYFLAKALRVFP